ncbi:MAG: NlpC/P60 family protein [Verrucomicrobiota bacterium]
MTCSLQLFQSLTVMQKALFRYWIILWLVAACLFLYPINTFLLRVGLLLSWLGVWAGCFVFGRRQKILCSALLVAPLLVVAFLICPGRAYDRLQLRDAYVHTLRSYEGTRYIWGGENRFGIDCSGLVRAGLIKSSFREALRTFNPRLARFALSLWWHDASAEALGQEYRHQTKHLIAAANLNELDQNKIMPGDIAVTVSGVHVMAYLGNSQWIEADPDLRKVVIVQTPERENPWFQETFKILRWRELDME